MTVFLSTSKSWSQKHTRKSFLLRTIASGLILEKIKVEHTCMCKYFPARGLQRMRKLLWQLIGEILLETFVSLDFYF